MNELEPKALEAAWQEYDQWAIDARGRKALAAAIRAYLAARSVPEGWRANVSAMIDRLQFCLDTFGAIEDHASEAADLDDWRQMLAASPPGADNAQVAPATFVIQIEADNSERYAIFSTMEKAEAWAAKTPDLTHIFADLVMDLPEWGNEAVEQRQ
jgi:hypothetical protein